MIQVCSQCGTRWNVRERQRMWCPRCRGTLMAPLVGAPTGDPRWRSPAGPQLPGPPVMQRVPPRLPPGFRWIAVRPGAAPPPRTGRRFRGPTPRYAVMPRWGLADQALQPAPAAVQTSPKVGPSAATVRAVLFGTVVVLTVAALVYAVRYALLIINRNTLLNSLVAGASLWLGVLASLAALVAMAFCFVALIQWLIARRAAAFTHHGWPEHRSAPQLWAGCLLPLANLVWAPVFVIELALVEGQYQRLQRPIAVWWIIWVLSNAVAIFAIATGFASDAQGIANNTVMTVVAYALAAATLATVMRVFEGFERKPVERPAHRWVVLPDSPNRSAAPASGGAVELEGQEPAA
ncbi:DUF4328 domain-containing protein [Mycobacterium simiae]|uniref:DUF4328 domain-containing protein n=1 Tax=Mycobacterium simiae TaxID=1784 RepID=A0A5B1BSA5_MYCSI|nr:DUF4328 domain-containing protein [Mycobacterium simiae]KAA1250223.1 DUF4328 domain-containing protein [Mycobacterium simiae]